MGIITNQEKIKFVQDYIDGIQYSIDILSNDIVNNPDGDIEEKPSRQAVLEDLIQQKTNLLNEIDRLKI